MSRPFKEVIFYNNLGTNNSAGGNTRIGLASVENVVKIGNNTTQIYKLWGGSINDFISDFELPSDFRFYWRTSTNSITGNTNEIFGEYHNTINFKVNLEFWYRLDNQETWTNYAPCSNITFDITLPNFLSYSAAVVGREEESSFKAYNPNLFPIILSNSKFAGSNKHTDNTYDGTTWGGLGASVPFLVFRYNVDSQDIQICLLSLSGSVWDLNNSNIYLGRASLTFTGFNATKKVKRNSFNTPQ